MRDNLAKLRSYLEEKLPQIRLIEPEGMYFAWMDFSALGLSNEELEELVSRKAKLWLDSGAVFGGGAEQFQRMVLACPWSVVEEALKRLEGALNQ